MNDTKLLSYPIRNEYILTTYKRDAHKISLAATTVFYCWNNICFCHCITICLHHVYPKKEIHIQYQGKEYEAYMLMKGNYKLNGELDGKRLCLKCDLQDEPTNDGGFYGICRLVDID